MRVNRKYGKQMKTRCGRSEACVLSKQAMRDAFIFVASMLLLLQQMVQGQTTEGGNATLEPRPALECVEATRSDLCSIIGSSTEHWLMTTDAIDVIFSTLYSRTGNHTYICNQFIVFSACFYAFRDCDPNDGGSQLAICEDVCPRISQLYHECIDVEAVQVLIHSVKNFEVKRFLKFALTFDCWKEETYILQGVNVSESCVDLSFIHDLFPGPAEGHPLSTAGIAGIAVGVVLVIVIAVVSSVVLLVVVVKLHRGKKSIERQMSANMSCTNTYSGELADMRQDVEDIKLSTEEQCFYEERFDKAVIAFNQLEMAEAIGEGTFGVVCKATLVKDLFTQSVAVKTARNLSSKQELCSLLNESLLMRRFDHPNIVGLLGVCFDTPDGYPYLILPYMINGNVRDYLKDKRVHHTNTAVLPDGFSMKTLVTMCVDVAKGMEYLSSNKFVHRDLAARNCMLDEKGVVRVGDFGLSRDVYAHLYYRADKHSKIPVKWSAPETLNDGLCTEKSDVWSYGVVCWEVFSLGSTPYPGVGNSDILQYIVSGERLKKPPLCPQNMYSLMELCWNIKPEQRPTFKQLVASPSLLP